MSKVKTITRTNAKQISIEIETALQSIASKYGLDFKLAGVRITSTTLKPRIEMSVVSESGNVLNTEAETFNLYKKLRGWNFSVGDTFTDQGQTFKLTGYVPRRSKFPFSAINTSSGATYKLAASLVESKF